MSDDGGGAESIWAYGLAGYVRAVAAVVGVPLEATGQELADTATAYLALTRRCRAYPDRDLMLVWGERDGWVVAVETDPGEDPIVIAYLDEDVLPGPHAVALFVTDLIAGRKAGCLAPPDFRDCGDRDDLHDRLARYATYP